MFKQIIQLHAVKASALLCFLDDGRQVEINCQFKNLRHRCSACAGSKVEHFMPVCCQSYVNLGSLLFGGHWQAFSIRNIASAIGESAMMSAPTSVALSISNFFFTGG